MLKIRLKRTGRKRQPHYRIVVAEAHRSRNSKSVDEIGYYNPRTQPSTVELDKDAAKAWLEKGAQPTETVEQIFVKEGVLKEIKRGSTLAKQRPKKKEAPPEEKAETPAAPVEKADAPQEKEEPAAEGEGEKEA